MTRQEPVVIVHVYVLLDPKTFSSTRISRSKSIQFDTLVINDPEVIKKRSIYEKNYRKINGKCYQRLK